MEPPSAPPIPMKIMEYKRVATKSTNPVRAVIKKPANPAKNVPAMVIKMANISPPKAPAIEAFQKPLNAPSLTMIPTTNPAKKYPKMYPQPVAIEPKIAGKARDNMNPTITALHFTIENLLSN